MVPVVRQVDEEHVDGARRKRKSRSGKRSQYDVRSVDEITKEDLDNIAYRSKDKIWDKENVSLGSGGAASAALGFRFPPLTARASLSGKLVSPVQTEDSRHQDGVS